MTPLITIAIATFNVEDYIEVCLKSVTQQTLQNIEILCIDDCSTDNTVKIIKHFQLGDKRIKLIEKKQNEGLSSSRNDAIQLAKGEYICFIDGDDIIDSQLLKKAYELALKDNSDLVIWDYVVFKDEKEILTKMMVTSSLKNVSTNNQSELIELPAFTWLKLIKTDKLRLSKIVFPLGLTKQDIPFHWDLVLNFHQVSLLPDRLIFYRQRNTAASYQSGSTQLDVIKVFQILEKRLKQQEVYPLFKDIFHKQKLNALYSMYDRVNPLLKKQTIIEILDNLNHADKDYIKSKKSLIKPASFFYKMLLGSRLNSIYFYYWCSIRSIYRSIKSLLCI